MSTRSPLHHRYKLLRLLLPLIIFILGCPGPGPMPPPMPMEQAMPQTPPTGITVLGKAFHLAPESTGSFLVQVHNPYDRNDLQKEVPVSVSLFTPNGQTQEVFAGRTDQQGLVEVRFAVPTLPEGAVPQQQLFIEAMTGNFGTLQTSEEVYIGRVHNILISTDKPIYQPGQMIHLRGLALDSLAIKPAQALTMTLTIADPEGNKLLRKELSTSQYGIASYDFALASQASSGDYLITAEMGPVKSTRSVEVKPYTLPRFKIDFTSEKSFYLPGETAKGSVNANYFFGKPVAGGKVIIKGFVTDAGRSQIFEINGETDATGAWTYEFPVPDYFVGQLRNDSASVDLEIQVIDSANHSESVDESITVAEQTILVDIVPESGALRRGLPNLLYVHTSYPNGADAQTAITLTAKNANGETIFEQALASDEFGLATVTITPTAPSQNNAASELPILILNVQANDGQGQQVTTEVPVDQPFEADSILMRPDQARYEIGDTINIDIHVTGDPQTVYLDVIKDRQTFGLIPLPVKDGVAQASIDADGSLLGTLELNAYVITNRGEIRRDQRFVLVNPAPTSIDIQADAEVYKPGDTATLSLAINRNGEPMPGVVGVSIVDESVFALGAQEPGFARTYFLLERQLLEPRYEIHDFTGFDKGVSLPYDNSPSSLRQGATNNAQQVALFGFFAEELAAIQPSEPVAVASAQHSANDQTAFRNSLAMGWGNRILLTLPLMGLAMYDGSRRRRYMLIGMVLVTCASVFFIACAPPAAMAPAAEAPAAASADSAAAPAAEESLAAMAETTATRGQAEPPRLRQFFPETLFWQPEQETDAEGRLQIQVPIADSITTWRVSVVASDLEGNLGSGQTGLRVFQDFFVEPDLPRFLTAGDQISVPVSIFNYLAVSQTVSLEIKPAAWFEFTQDPTLSFAIGPNQVSAAYLPIRVIGHGTHELQVTATGDTMSDAIVKQVEVLPDGKPVATSQSDKLEGTEQIKLRAPQNAVPGTARLVVKLYPGVISQVIDGLEGMLREPYGCFEQTSSTTYPNVLVLDYLKTTNQANPRLQLTAEQYINLGYQRLLSFEVRSEVGGFSLFGEAPAQTMLTAYGLMEFTDMSEVSYVDPALLQRTASFLLSQQNGDGSWTPQGMTIESGLEGIGNDTLMPTAYIAWALADAGYAQKYGVQNAAAYLRQQMETLLSASANQSNSNSPLATPVQVDSYTLAMVANALIAIDPQDATASRLLNELINRPVSDANGYYYWSSGVSNYLGGGGEISKIETTAMTAIALLRTGKHLDAAQSAIDYLITQRDGGGMYYSTQTTVLVLKALLLAAKGGSEGTEASVTVTLDGGRSETVTINQANADVVNLINFEDLGASEHELTLQIEGERKVQYQVSLEYYLPWSEVQPEVSQEPGMRIDVAYDRTELQVNDTVGVQATVELLAPGIAGTVLVDLGIPPGFAPLTEDLDQLVNQQIIDRYELTGRQIIIYMTDVPSRQVITLNYRLLARFPIIAQTPSSQAYDYYSPEQLDTDAPQRIQVKLGTPQQ